MKSGPRQELTQLNKTSGRLALLFALVSRWNVRQANVPMRGGHYSARVALCITIRYAFIFTKLVIGISIADIFFLPLEHSRFNFQLFNRSYNIP
jgi:hypothetical protein